MTESVKSFQDFKLIETNVCKYVDEYGHKYAFKEHSIGFIFFILEKYFDLQEDEAFNAITDTIFITRKSTYNDSEDMPHDKGIDAIIIDEEKNIVHILNFKHTTKEYDKIKNKHFEAGEIPKIKAIVKDIFEKNIPANANPNLREKLKELFCAQEKGKRFKFEIHFISNGYLGFTDDEKSELNHSLQSDYKGYVNFDFILTPNIVEKLTHQNEKIDAKFKITGKNFFDKNEYGHRALITEIQAKDLIRIVLNSDDIRKNIEAEDVDIKDCPINENSFEDNVRIYLKQKSSINKNIKKTALDDDESSKFFFFNNGVTITCDKFEYQGKMSPVVELNGIQVVNGSQTIHSLKEAFDENSESFDDISLLCRIYETQDLKFKSQIAEYTNNQNPVSNRDVRSIDIIQIKLEEELKVKGFFYERKKEQYEKEPKNLKIDSEKFGQSYLAYYLEMPAEAKNQKAIIFSAKYNDIFNDNITADIVLKVINLYNSIESKKLLHQTEKPFLNHATYYIMYFISLLEEANKTKQKDSMDYYNEAVEKIDLIRNKQKALLGDDFSDATLFKGNVPKRYLSELGL